MNARRLLIVCVASCAAGCTNMIDAESALIEQAQRGLDLTRSTLADRDKLALASFEAQRRRLDAAFDDDVKARPAPLDAKWVIEHRKAYAVGIDSLHLQQLSWLTRTRTDSANLDASAEALRRLQAVKQLQRGLVSGSTFKE
ncbi:MAG: hypothetical protein QM770_03785 [Tepidisphaeraceae bacterium]